MPRSRTTLAEDLAAARAAVPEFAERAARLVEGIGNPKAVSLLPGWNAADVAVHLGLACTAYSAAAAGALDVGHWETFVPEHPDLAQRVAVLNATTLSQAAPEAYLAAPAQIRTGAATLVAALADRDPREPCTIPWFGADEPLTLAAVTGLFLSETALHTLDLARATGQKWLIPPPIARQIISLAYLDTIPRTVDHTRAATMHAAIRIHVRGGVTIGVEVDGPLVQTHRDPAPGRTDCHISVDPVAFVLAASGRSSQARQIVTGRMIAYGRKPWLGPMFARLFIHP
ncbi:maleylpyruvate isomerase family mycothiol-dependent enzyme [Catenulispora sp. NF23]|uniref:Maleylpyruvate isomerase family mycothiol-dependent enzyme n=1 Tax=Catenulispora pinistramenti TaxID=2705254 RepID=A0ABS5L933_9ACTN|nr:maleylpyruvate isomerase family mycothiol-dependent enzyme [Catenulispora pinistramenti]MBS2540163.1 maleylpyruvate isomerase family mycothiol-dependent enzyme [Catenulispora pinistramenti]MBS2554704.1 maleylpyruvate isomerase family mycothiol-dependent enzyme [Catenulispora pinistramenti]